MRRSIRRTLLGWYAAILLVVVGLFGALLYEHRRSAVFDAIDGALESRAAAAAATVEWEPGEGFDLEETEQYLRLVDPGAPGSVYLLVWDDAGVVLARSAGAPELAAPPPPGFRDRDGARELLVPGPHRTRVLAGRETAAARGELAGLLAAILVVGAAVLLLSFGLGWILVGRVLGPIERMTETASRISAENRSERIDVGRTESELGRLAATLNSAFDRLDAAFERQTRFTASASHELRTPLSVVMTNAELALARERSGEEYRELLEACLRAARRMTGVVDGLLTLARSDAGEIELARERVDLLEVARETVRFFAPLAAESGVEIALAGEETFVQGDPRLLADAVANLVGNAVRYNREGGRVDVAVGAEEGEAVLRVSDTGVGIPADALPHVFDRFFRVDPARSREVGGSGLGLAIVRFVVEAHGGTVTLESEEGKGTVATVRWGQA